MTELKRIVLAEDNPNDVELTLSALAENEVRTNVPLSPSPSWGGSLPKPHPPPGAAASG